MKLNTDKYNVHIASHKFEYLWRDIGNNRICESNYEKMLVILTSNSLNYVAEICRKSIRKLTALAQLTNILPFCKMKILMASFLYHHFANLF